MNKTNNESKNKFLEGIKPTKVPPIASWIVTTRCNLRCLHCYPQASVNSCESELTESQQVEVIKILAQAGVKCVVLSGGEVLILKHIMRLVDAIVQRGMEAWICTNGTLMTARLADELKDVGVSMVSVSVDGAEETTHDTLRGCKGAFEKAINAINILSSKGISVMADYTATKANKTNVNSLKEVVQNAGAKTLSIKRFRPLGRGIPNANLLQLSLSEYKDLMDNYFYDATDSQPVYTCTDDPAVYAYLRIIKKTNINDVRNLISNIGCMAGLGWFGILPKGDVIPCPLLKIPIGNVLSDNLPSVFSQSPVILNLIDRNNLKGACGVCSERNNCGGCRAHAFAVSGDLLEEDPFCLVRSALKGK